MSEVLVQKIKSWLQKSACPLWLEAGVDWNSGGFYESLTLQGVPAAGPRRVMVQSRQIFSSHMAMKLGLLSQFECHKRVLHGIDFVLKYYSDKSGGFHHAVDESFKPLNKPMDLYAQAFALFGLAHAHAILTPGQGQSIYKNRALELVQYLKSHRKVDSGGYTELGASGVMFEANPLMHLFEATLYWAEIDKDKAWDDLNNELSSLCLNTFIDKEKSLLAEHYDSSWKPLLNNGRYVFEPGHHYEWVWLLGRYQKFYGQDTSKVRVKLYDIAEKYGIQKDRKSAFDEVWSDLTPAKKTSRFWPQCERVKAALQLGMDGLIDKKVAAESADEAIEGLFKFLEVDLPGLWFDTWQEDGVFTIQPAKASSFYHIIGAMVDYVELRKLLS